MGKLFAIIGAILYYLFYPFILLTVILGPLMDFDSLIDVFKLDAPRAVLGIWVVMVCNFYILLSFKSHRLGWLYRKIPVLMPFLQMCLIMFFGIEIALFFANLWADKQFYSEGVALVLAVVSFIVTRLFLSYWYAKYPISYKVHKM